MAYTTSLILACDIGGTHITSAIVDTNGWKVLSDSLTRQHVISSADAKSIFQTWSNNIKACLDKSGLNLNKIGIAMPGPFDYENGISLMKDQDKYDNLYKINITEGLQDALQIENLEIKYINDAASFLQGEVYAQSLENEENVLGITLGTGLGSAVWNKGNKAFDANLWQAPYQKSIFEEHLVTRWFTKRFFELSGNDLQGVKEIIDQHNESEHFKQLLEEYRLNLKDFLAYFSQLHKCSHFIIGGNIANAWNLINDNKTFADYKITTAQYAEKAALIGAASTFC